MSKEKNLTSKIAIGGAWVFLRLIVVNVSNLFVVGILARQLSPSIFGTAALAMVFVQLLSLLSAEGVNRFVIYDNTEGREERLHSAFWINLIAAFLCLAIGLIAARPVARFFDAEILSNILVVMLMGIPVQALSKIPEALLKKQLQFKSLQTYDIFFQLLGGGLAVAMVLQGFGIWSLVVPAVIFSPIRAIAIFRLSSWRPRLIANFREWPKVLAYSANIIGSGLCSFILSNGDKLLIAKLLGSTALGFYNVAWRSSNLVIRTITQISNQLCLPALANLTNESEVLLNALRRILRLISTISFPLLVGLFVLADEFILSVYGANWQTSVLPLQILIIYVMRFVISAPVASMFERIGRTDINLKIGLLNIPFYLGAIIIGSNFGLIGVAIGATISRTSLGFVHFLCVSRVFKVSFLDVVQPIFPPLLASVVMGVTIYAVKILTTNIPGMNNCYIALVVLTMIGALTYIVLLRVWFNTLAVELVRIANPLLGRFGCHFSRLLNVDGRNPT